MKPAVPSSYTVGGNVTGLSGTGLVLEINGGQDLPVTTNGPFTFPTAVASTSSYTVTVKSQPNGYRELCAIANGSDTVTGASISNVTINCSTMVGFLYVDMSGSSEQIVSYGISPGTGTPVPFGQPIPMGAQPACGSGLTNGIVTSPDRRFVYVANPGSSSISIYAANPGSGVLTASGSLALPLQPFSMFMSPAGFLFVYGATPGQGSTCPYPVYNEATLSSYAVTASTGALVPIGTALTFDSTTTLFLNLVTTVDGKRLYVETAALVNGEPLGNPYTVTAYAIDAATGALTAGPTMTTSSAISTMAVDPLGRYLYIVYPPPPTIGPLPPVTVMPYGIEPVTGTLTPIGTGTPVASNSAALTADPSGRYLYLGNALSEGNEGVQALAVDESSGTVVPLGSQISTSEGPATILCDPSGHFVYVANSGAPTGAPQSWPVLAAFEISTEPASAGQLLPSGVGSAESLLYVTNVSMAVVE